ncbi:MAG: NUDIX domain-containing protein [Candidatus Doudnabacteria bacterium]|nr:NUDIX domain-containing protein [bacterium]MDZ4243698.1 NUDIX domain-containing protein [Candidatus Doudnabacteria bacterium]
MAERVFTQSFSVVGAIIEKEGKIFLVKENQGADKGKWNQPAGWLDVGEDPVVAIKREVKEETGFDFEPTSLVGIYSLVRKDRLPMTGYTPHALKLIFKGNISGTNHDSNEEIAEVRWFGKEEILKMGTDQLRDEDIKQEVEDYFAGRSFPLDIIRHTVQK